MKRFLFGFSFDNEPVNQSTGKDPNQNFQFLDRPAPIINRQLVMPDMMTRQETIIWMFPHNNDMDWKLAPLPATIQRTSSPSNNGRNVYNLRPANGIAYEYDFNPEQAL